MSGKILVTGSSGFIGRHVMWRLAGPAVPYDIEVSKQQDVRMLSALRKSMRGCESVVHMAALVGTEECNRHAFKAEAINSTGTFAVLEAARQVDIKRVLVASSVAAERRDSAYGWTQYVAEQWCQMARERYGMEIAVLRFANIYGPGSIQKGSVVAKWMRQILYREAPVIEVYGGSQVRDFTFVGDVADCAVARLEDPEPWDDEPWHYVGTRRTTTIDDLLQVVCSTARDMGITKEVSVRHTDPQGDEGHVEVPQVADVRFTCHTTLEAGIRATWEYFVEVHDRAMRAA